MERRGGREGGETLTRVVKVDVPSCPPLSMPGNAYRQCVEEAKAVDRGGWYCNIDHLTLQQIMSKCLVVISVMTTLVQPLSLSLLQWDPSKKYKGIPKLLSGGYELWCLTYPMLTSNPQAQRPDRADSAARSNTSDNSSSSSLRGCP